MNGYCNYTSSHWGPHNSLLAASQLEHSHITCSHGFSSNVKDRLFAVLTKSRVLWEEAFRCAAQGAPTASGNGTELLYFAEPFVWVQFNKYMAESGSSMMKRILCSDWSRWSRKKKWSFWAYNESFIVKLVWSRMAGFWPLSFNRFF